LTERDISAFTRRMASKSDTSGAGKPLLVRVQPPLHKRLSDWIKAQPPDDLLTFPEAVRRLTEIGLRVSPSPDATRKPACERRERENAYDF